MAVRGFVGGRLGVRHGDLKARSAKRLFVHVLGLGFLGLSALAHATPPKADPMTASSLRDTQAIELRIARIAYRLQTANAIICKDIFPLNGLTVKVLNADASLASRAAHYEALGMGKLPTVYLVAPGSEAERAGLIAGDQILAVGTVAFDSLPPAKSPFRKAWETQERGGSLTLTVQNNKTPPRLVTIGSAPGCNALFNFIPSKIVNAETNGNRVFVHKGLLDLTRNDDELAVVLAHELAHVLMHHGYPGNETAMLNRKTRAVIEQDADRLGLLLMANAGYDPAVAGPWKRYSDGQSRGFFTNLIGGYGAYMPTKQRARFLDEQSRLIVSQPKPLPPSFLGITLPRTSDGTDTCC